MKIAKRNYVVRAARTMKSLAKWTTDHKTAIRAELKLDRHNRKNKGLRAAKLTKLLGRTRLVKKVYSCAGHAQSCLIRERLVMLTKFKIKARYPEAKIEEVEVVRETESCVFLPTGKTKSNPKGETKALKMNDRNEYHDTWESAHASLTNKAAEQVANARRSLELANAFAGNVKGIRRPCV